MISPRFFDKIPLSLILLVLSYVVFDTYYIRISDDMQWYTEIGLDIYHGNGFAIDNPKMIIRPIFPLMIAASYWLLGPSVWSAFWVVRIFCIFNPIVIYFLGKKLFGKWVGFAAGILILSSFSMNIWAYRHLDAIWPFWVFLGILSLCYGFEKKSTGLFAISGICLSLAYLTKEVAVLFFGFPILILFLIDQYRKKKNYKNLGVLYIISLVCILPWMVFQQIKGEGINFLGAAGPAVIDAILHPAESEFVNKTQFSDGNTVNNIIDIFQQNHILMVLSIIVICFVIIGTILYGIKSNKKIRFKAVIIGLTLFSMAVILIGSEKVRSGFLYFYSGQRNSFSKHFMLAPIMVISWFYLISLSFKDGEDSKKIMASSLICFLPIIYFLGLSNFRVGQGLYFYYLSYLATAAMTFELIKHGTQNYQLRILIFAFSILSLSGVQYLYAKESDKGGKTFIKRTNMYLLSKGIDRAEHNSQRLFGLHDKNFLAWIKTNIPLTSKIMLSEREYIIDKYFMEEQHHRYIGMPINEVRRIEIDNIHKNRIIMISGILRGKPSNSDILILDEQRLFNKIKGNKIDYVLVNKRHNYLSFYFEQNDSFQKIKEFENGAIKVYKIGELKERIHFKPLMVYDLFHYFAFFKEKYPIKYENDITKILHPLFNLDKNTIDAFLEIKKQNNEFTLVYSGTVY